MINLHNTHHKVIAKLYSFTLRRKTTDKHNRSEISLDTGDSQFERPVPSSPYTQQPLYPAARSWQHRCEEWVGSKGASKADLGFAHSCL